MTTTINVKARAWGASVTVSTITEGTQGGHNIDDQVTELGSNEERRFDIQPGQRLTVEHGPDPQNSGQLQDVPDELTKATDEQDIKAPKKIKPEEHAQSSE